MSDFYNPEDVVIRTMDFIESGKKENPKEPYYCENLGGELVLIDMGANLVRFDGRTRGEMIRELRETEHPREHVEHHIVRVRYPIKDASRNGMGNLQGGMMASLIDNAFAILLVPLYGAFMTIDINVNYFAPVSREFDTVEIEAEIIKQGKTTKFMQARVYRGDGKLAALAGTNVMMVKKK